MNQQNKPRLLNQTDLQLGAKILAQAFDQDPLFVAFFSNKNSEKRHLQLLFETVLSLAIGAGMAYGVGAPLGGVMIWSRTPGPFRPPSLRSLWKSLRFLWTGAWWPLLNFLPLLGRLEEFRHQLLPQKYIYLQVLAVSPESQGKGFSSRLVRWLNNKADSWGMPVCLETNNPRNVPIYQHFEYEPLRKLSKEKYGADAWFFVRPYRDPSSA